MTDPTVLVVDDEESVAEGYSLWLSDEYEVRTATDGAEALEKLDESVDAMLLDRRMPGMSGDEVLESVREEGYDVRVAMVTAVDPDFDIVDMSFDAYLTKPVDRDDLVATVEQLLTLAEYDEKMREQFRLAEKKANLELRKSDEELRASEEYQRITERLKDLQEETADMVGDLDHEAFSDTVRNLI